MQPPPARRRWSPARTLIPLAILLLLWSGLLTGCAGKRMSFEYLPHYGVESESFRRSLEAFGAPLVSGNRLTLLENGDGFFPAMLEALSTAEHSINMEMYIFEDDEIGVAFARVLEERSRRGVEVHLLVDAFGARYGRLGDTLKAAGVELEIYHPVRWGSLRSIEDRSHRKLLVVDGRVAFVGGASIDHRWKGDTRTPREWRDLMVRIEGPVVSQLQAIFLEDWLHMTGEVIHGPHQFPTLEPVGDTPVQAIRSSSGDANSMSKLMYYMAIQAARRRIWIENAYFLPDRQILVGLKDASRRGVDVRVLVPGRLSDFPVIWQGARLRYEELLEAGVEILEYQPSMLHTKMMVVDDLWSTVGSINFVNRSMRKNAEVNIAVYDRRFAEELLRVFEEDAARSVRIRLEAWKQRPLQDRGGELLWWYLGQLF